MPTCCLEESTSHEEYFNSLHKSVEETPGVHNGFQSPKASPTSSTFIMFP